MSRESRVRNTWAPTPCASSTRSRSAECGRPDSSPSLATSVAEGGSTVQSPYWNARASARAWTLGPRRAVKFAFGFFASVSERGVTMNLMSCSSQMFSRSDSAASSSA